MSPTIRETVIRGDHQPTQVASVELTQAMQTMSIQLQAMSIQMHSMKDELTSLQTQLQNPSPHQNIAELEDQYVIVASAFEQRYLAYNEGLQILQGLQQKYSEEQRVIGDSRE